ncbi:ArsR/SmtB family transcription factor [Sciscionella sediminilitoris]|uniref:ArsR/SmtB family transcription factor n=1 Tax=Sciscionella sediminilitoris TaxID=1445613 RepID=UPI000B1E7853|nr:winged helix-turn-helix domain-containing protein [Sciscionella sp. SE31]
MRSKAGQQARALSSLARAVQPPAELFRLPVSTFDSGAAAAYYPDRSASAVSSLLYRFHDAAILPYGQALANALETDRNTRSDIILDHGVDGFLRSLDPLCRWQFPQLEIPNGSDHTIRIDEQGLLIAPSIFHCDRPAVFMPNSRSNGGPPILVCPSPITIETAHKLWDSGAHAERALAALLGRTRSKLLAALTGGSSTTELALRLGISAASVSQHTGVLREAGLITTDRHQNTVQHRRTPLGLALVNRIGAARRSGQKPPPVATEAHEPCVPAPHSGHPVETSAPTEAAAQTNASV